MRAYCAFSSYEGCSQINDNISKNKVLSLMVLMFYLDVIPLLFMDTITFQAKLKTQADKRERRTYTELRTMWRICALHSS